MVWSNVAVNTSREMKEIPSTFRKEDRRSRVLLDRLGIQFCGTLKISWYMKKE